MKARSSGTDWMCAALLIGSGTGSRPAGHPCRFRLRQQSCRVIRTAHQGALRRAGFRYTVLSHQSSHGVSNQTARSDLQKLAGRGLLIPGKDGKREIFRVPADLAARLPGGIKASPGMSERLGAFAEDRQIGVVGKEAIALATGDLPRNA
jgi:hypothetical protein